MEQERGRVTIKSIASELGLSFSTVARALDNNPVVRQETRELVQRKAKEMNYTRGSPGNPELFRPKLAAKKHQDDLHHPE